MGKRTLPKTSKSTSLNTDIEAAIRHRAYLLWEADGRPEGRAEHYWQLAQAAPNGPAKKKRASPAKAASPAPEKKTRKASKASKAS